MNIDLYSCGTGAVAGIAVGSFVCGVLLSSVIAVVIVSRWCVNVCTLSIIFLYSITYCALL